MGLKFEYAPGATPLDPDEAAGLIPSQIINKGQLNAWEYQNVAEGRAWALSRKHKNVPTPDFAFELHRRMFGQTWKWAGTQRKKETTPGIDPSQIQVELKKLFDDVAYQVEHKSLPIDEIAAKFHHRLVSIHCFPNGNGRHARLLIDLFLTENGAKPFTWGAGDLVSAGDVRERYLAALRAADGKDYSLLLEFVRSGQTVS